MCIRAKLAAASLAFDRWALGRMADLLFPNRLANAAEVKHAVIYRVGAIGDTVAAIPALMQLRKQYPEATFTLITSSGSTDIAGAKEVLAPFTGLIDHIVTYLPGEIKRRSFQAEIKERILEKGGPVDLFIDIPVSLQTLKRGLQELYLARYLESRFVIGFDLLLPSLFKSHYSREYPERILRTENWLSGLFSTSAKPEEVIAGNIFMPVPEALDLDPNKPVFAVNAGAKLAIKRWPPESFAQSVHLFLQARPEHQVVLLGSASEVALNETIRSEILKQLPKAQVINLAGKLNLAETWSLLNQSNLVLSNDTGAMHMAGLLGKPTVTPMSGQYPAPLWHPSGNDFIPVRHQTPCSPCFLDQCRFGEQVCLTRITPEAVSAELDRLSQ